LAAAGDSLLDLGMLRVADVAVRPAHGELHEQNTALAQLLVTPRAGLLGGEDVVTLLHRVMDETVLDGGPPAIAAGDEVGDQRVTSVTQV
jgi:hypothetical protein